MYPVLSRLSGFRIRTFHRVHNLSGLFAGIFGPNTRSVCGMHGEEQLAAPAELAERGHVLPCCDHYLF